MKNIIIIVCFVITFYKCEIIKPEIIDYDADSFDNGDSFYIRNKFRGKFLKPVSVENNDGLENAVFKSTMDDINRYFKNGIENIKRKTKRVDIVFLIDSSSSVGKVNFISETKFVKKLLSEFNVSYNYTRVALVTFSSQGKVVRHIDQISDPSVENDKCKLLNDEIPRINFVGGGTYTYGALQEAKEILDKARKNSKKIIFLVTDGFSNGKNPVPMAMSLKDNNVTIFTIGIQSGNYIELHNISSSPEKEHSFLLDSFIQFESLARKALHADYKIGHSMKLNNHTRCSSLCEDSGAEGNYSANCCDENADCTCGTSSGHYVCQCHPGYYGSGLREHCNMCPNGTYWHNSNMCRPCPDINHITIDQPPLNVSFCVCKTGFKQTGDGRCEGITCPKLLPPQNGYFVKQPTSCANVLNAACGARCKSGYQLTGTSLRLCQENGTWSGNEASCALKTCPSLVIPLYGLAICRNKDLNLFFDYSPRNRTFMEDYENETKRVTEPMPIDTDCTYKCKLGFYLIGSRSRNCLPLSKWDGLQTTCKQIVCSPLPEPTYGEYDSSECIEAKVPFYTNCTLNCPEGFAVRGPATKTCMGKKNGVWTHKSKNAKCVDITPPSLTCPSDISIFVEASNDFAIIKSFPIPHNISDTTGRNVTFWLMQTVNATNGVRLNIGNHTFTYIASDSFNNKANCSFIVQVIDKIPPVIENCEDPEEFRIVNAKTDFIDWEEPIFYDNSNAKVIIKKSLSPGIIGVGHHKVEYTATDIFNNSDSCIMNITVKEIYCTPLKTPLNGQSMCAKNITHTWCQIICNTGFAVFDSIQDEYSEMLNLTCLNEKPDWKFENVPDCTPIDLPNSVEQILTIPLDSDGPSCENETFNNEIQQVLIDHLKKYMCNDIEDCDIISKTSPECNSVVVDDSENDNEISNKTYYKIVKRQIQSAETKKTKSKNKSNIRIKLYTKIGRKLGVWRKGKTLAENLQKVRDELHSTNESTILKRRLQSINIDVRKLKIEDFLKCTDGSIFKKHLCAQCPRGTFHDALFNRCVMCPIGSYNSEMGQVLCSSCPLNYSTRKGGRRNFQDCIAQCPPGTIAKIKIPRKKSRADVVNTKSLMPFCRKCNPGEYQSKYDQTNCQACPFSYTSLRGSQSRADCIPKDIHPCRTSTPCSPFGICVPELNDDTLYHCQCNAGYDGAHCEHKLDLCLSAPCYNNGRCHYINSSAIACACSAEYVGLFCEELRSPCLDTTCQNGGSCFEIGGTVNCECTPGYEGDYCDRKVDYCRHNLCENGRCENALEGYQCKCPPGIIGKRCHLRPCDYLPCHRNAICIDLPHFPATQDSYMCKCPVGLKGYDCSQAHNPCNVRPCKNNGKCTPLVLRTASSTDLDEEKYREYTCKCPPYFYGKNCEILTTPDFFVKFPKPSITNYIKMKGPEKNIKEISFCVWMQTNDSFNYGTVLSYATLDLDNMLTFTDYNGFVLYVHGQHVVTDIVINDGIWHFICVAWTSKNGYYEIYLDGQLQHAGLNLSSDSVIEKDGVLIVGQEQDQINGDFSESESFVGNIAYLDIWDNFIKATEVKEFYSSCEPYRGNLYAWTDFKMGIQGSVEVFPSNFCKSCKSNLNLVNGQVQVIDGKAFYRCDDGYKIHGNIMRKCLRTSNWSSEIPYCSIVTCKPLQQIFNGLLSYDSLTYGGFARYTCHGGYVLEGNGNRICLSNGQWSGIDPQCISKVRCPAIKLAGNATITYGTENGPVNASLLELDVGTFAEVICIVKGSIVESFLTCTETGQWDNISPTCVDETITTEIKTSPTTQSSTEHTTIYPIMPTTKEIKTTTENVTKLTTTAKPLLSTTTIQSSTESTAIETPLWNTSTLQEISTTSTQSTTELIEYKTTPIAETSTLPSTIQKETTISVTTESSSNKKLPTNIEVLPDNYPPKEFWTAFKQFLFSGCKTKLKMKQSELCSYVDEIVNLRNLTMFEPPKTEEYRNMDVKLYNLLSENINKFYITNPDVTFGTFFNFILYGLAKGHHAEKLSDKMEDSLRFVLCFYINTFTWDSKLFASIGTSAEGDSSTKNVTDKLKSLILQATIPVYKHYLIRKVLNDSESTEERSSEESYEETTELTTTELDLPTATEAVQHCNLKDISESPANGIIKSVTGPNNETIISELEKLRQYSIYTPVGTVVQYGCTNGLAMFGNSMVTCKDDGTWDSVGYICKEMYCDKPPRPVSMNHYSGSGIKNKFKFGDKIRLHCNEGHVLHGNPEIICNPPGKWSKVLARCAKISCNKPKLPAGAEIIKGRSYLYDDKILIECESGDVEEIYCQSNGKWSSSGICL